MSDAAKRAREQDARLRRLYDVDAKLGAIPELLDAAWAEWRELIGYYETLWRHDLEELDGTPQGELGVLSEDGVWNEMGEFYETMKAIEQTAAQNVAQYEGSDQ